MAKRVDPKLMKAGEEAFWEEFEELERPEERYYVIDKRTGDIVVEDAKLTKERRKIEV